MVDLPHISRTDLLKRSADENVFTGVAGGLAAMLGVRSLYVRIGFVLLTIVNGSGALLYLAAYLLSSPPERSTLKRPTTRRNTVGFALVVTGLMVASAGSGFVVPGHVVLPMVLVTVGSTLVWDRLGNERFGPLRTVFGLLALAFGIGWFLANSDAFESARSVFLGVGVTTAALLVLFGPWLMHLGKQLSAERRERIRSEERAELSAHLHDSVLNTLALIQRTEASPEVAALARRQERELRSWLQGRSLSEDERLGAAIDGLVSRVEATYRISIDVVLVGDHPMNDRLQGFVAAMQEAVTNAARHAHVEQVSVYVEVDSVEIIAYVRDQGVGFDLVSIAADRQGIAESIKGRMRRLGGQGIVRSALGEGTEVELHLPLEKPL